MEKSLVAAEIVFYERIGKHAAAPVRIPTGKESGKHVCARISDRGRRPVIVREIPDPLRTPDSPPSPDSPAAPGSPEARPATPDSPLPAGAPQSPDYPPPPDSPSSPDSPPERGSTQVPYSFLETNSFQANDSLDSLEPAASDVPSVAPQSALPPVERPRTPITPKPRAIFIAAALLALTLLVWFAASRAGWLAPDPLEVARAQILDLDQGRWRAAYDLFSPRYRAEVPFETWRDMALMHSRMFHTREMRFADDREWNNGAALEAHLVAESGDRYLARFTLVYAEGQWWVDDLHWGREPDTEGQVTV